MNYKKLNNNATDQQSDKIALFSSEYDTYIRLYFNDTYKLIRIKKIGFKV